MPTMTHPLCRSKSGRFSISPPPSMLYPTVKCEKKELARSVWSRTKTSRMMESMPSFQHRRGSHPWPSCDALRKHIFTQTTIIAQQCESLGFNKDAAADLSTAKPPATLFSSRSRGRKLSLTVCWRIRGSSSSTLAS